MANDKEKQTGALLVVPAEKLAELDAFAESNNLSVLTEGKGSFTAAINVAAAINQLKQMLTPEVMQPIMGLQGTALGFKTDKDKEGGYPIDTVREVFVEATLKGFKMVGNQSNIIAGRFYATKEGFEDFFLRLAKKGEFTDFRDSYSMPKIITEVEAHVTVSASWKFKGIADKMENVPISIRINKGQGADAILGKAKRKLLAKIYARVTGTVVTDGEAGDPEAIPVSATVTSSEQTAAAPQAAKGATEEQKTLLREILANELDAKAANKWLAANKAIPEGGTFLDVSEKLAAKIIGKPKDFIAAIHAG